jgi:hypothetical protein
MKRILLLFLITCFFLVLQNDRLGARYSSGGVELVKFMTLNNPYCRTEVFHEYNKYDEINKYLSVAFQVFPGFVQEQVGLRLNEELFESQKRELEIQIISDKTLNSRVIGRYDLLLPVEGLYDSQSKTIYISKDYDTRTPVHEYFHFLRDLSGIAISREREEKLADLFSDRIVDAMEKNGFPSRSPTALQQ